MTFDAVNLKFVIVAGLAAWILGFIYYTVVSSAWVEAMGTTKEAMCANKSKAPLVFALVAALVTSYVLAGLLMHVVPGQITVKNGVISGAIIWVGYVLPVLAVNNAFGQRKFSLTVIDSGYWLLALALEGAILGALSSGQFTLPF